MRIHDPKLIAICEKCGKVFKNNSNVRKHEKTAHSDQKPEPQQCTICNNWYTNLKGLRIHMRNAHDPTGEGMYRCNICDHVSPTKNALQKHIHINHECEGKYKCTVCEKLFKRRLHLEEHMTMHTGEALYVCPHCPATFTHNANCYTHLKNAHKAEYAASKQQNTASHILKIAIVTKDDHAKASRNDISADSSSCSKK